MPLVVFDLDGTLIDSRRDLADSTNEMLETYGAPALALDAVTGMVGEGALRLVMRALAASGLEVDARDALARFRTIYDRRLVVHTRPYRGTIDMLRRAADRASLAVLTNKPEAPARKILEAFGMAPLFTWVVGGDSELPRKPDPAGLRHLMQAAGAGADGTVFVGDSRIDIETGRRAGVRVCGVRYGFGAGMEGALAGAEWTIDAPEELIGVLDRSFARQ